MRRVWAEGKKRGNGRQGPVPLVWGYRPVSYWDVAGPHLPPALAAGIALALPYAVALDQLPLIPCTFLSLTGLPCPFCGLTRSFWAIAHGNWAVAVHHAPLALAVYGATALVFAWHSAALLTGLRLKSRLFHWLKTPLAVWLMVAMTALNWAYRLGSGLE